MHVDSNVAQKIKEGSSEKCDLRWELKDEDWSGQGWGKRRGSSQTKGGGKGQEKRKRVHKKTEEKSLALKKALQRQCGQKREKNGSKQLRRGQQEGGARSHGALYHGKKSEFCSKGNGKSSRKTSKQGYDKLPSHC